MKIKIKFVWYDIWIGCYIDLKNRKIYVTLIPTLPIIIELPNKNLFHKDLF